MRHATPDPKLKPLACEVLVISLTSDVARRTAIEAELRHKGVDFTFFDAVNGYALAGYPAGYDRKTRLRQFGFDMRPGEFGCFLSHKAIWEYVLASQQTVLVLEDDAHLEDHFFEALEVAQALTIPWDLMRLSGTRTRPVHQLVWASFGRFDVVEELKDPSLTTGYLLRPSGAEKLLRTAHRFYIPVDNFLELRHEHHMVNLAIFPYPVTSREEGSTIGVRGVVKKSVGYRLRRLWFRAIRDTVKACWAWGRVIHHWHRSR